MKDIVKDLWLRIEGDSGYEQNFPLPVYELPEADQKIRKAFEGQVNGTVQGSVTLSWGGARHGILVEHLSFHRF